MIRSVGRLGPVKVVGLVLWELRYNLLAVAIVVALLLPFPDASQNEYAAAVLSVLGIAASVFIGFRNTTAYNRWWEARTLWGAIIINSRTLHNGLTSMDTGSPGMAPILDRMRRRQVRYCWQLAAEMRGVPPVAGAVELTPEDPAAESSTDLLNRQAADVGELVNSGFIGDQARLVLMTANTGAATAQSGLERIRNEPIPLHYDFYIRVLAWFVGVMAFNRLDGAAQNHIGSVVVGVLLLAIFVIAERVGGLIEAPMNNTVFDIPMYRICAIVSGNLLGAGHPLAQPREGERSIVWM